MNALSAIGFTLGEKKTNDGLSAGQEGTVSAVAFNATVTTINWLQKRSPWLLQLFFFSACCQVKRSLATRMVRIAWKDSFGEKLIKYKICVEKCHDGGWKAARQLP